MPADYAALVTSLRLVNHVGPIQYLLNGAGAPGTAGEADIGGVGTDGGGNIDHRRGEGRAVVDEVRVHDVAAAQNHAGGAHVDRRHGGSGAVDVEAGRVSAF